MRVKSEVYCRAYRANIIYYDLSRILGKDEAQGQYEREDRLDHRLGDQRIQKNVLR